MKKTWFVLFVTVFAVEAFAASQGKLDSLFEAMSMDKVMDDSINAMMELEMKQNPKLEKIRPEFREFLLKTLSWNAIKNEVSPLYAKAFTDDEIEQLTNFYRSPIGKKALAEMPALMAQGAAIGQRRVTEKLPEFRKSVESKLKK